MTRPALLLLLIAAPAAAAPHGPGCRLTTRECLIIAQEIASEQVLRSEDERYLRASGLTPYDAAMRGIDRHFDREQERYKHLPVPISNEWARMELCAHEEQANDPRCR